MLAGIVASQVLNLVTRRFTPLQQWVRFIYFYFDILREICILIDTLAVRLHENPIIMCRIAAFSEESLISFDVDVDVLPL